MKPARRLKQSPGPSAGAAIRVCEERLLQSRGRNPLIEVERIAGTALASEGVHVPARAVVVECAVVLTGPVVSTDI
jgi:hypothetical protein